MSEVTFIPNEYAAKGVVIGHPETIAEVKSMVDALRARITELTQGWEADRVELDRVKGEVLALKEDNKWQIEKNVGMFKALVRIAEDPEWRTHKLSRIAEQAVQS